MIVTVTFNPSYDKTLEVHDFAAGRTVRARTLRRQPAGKGVNVSRCAADLGEASVVTGFVGSGEAEVFAGSFTGTQATQQFVVVAGATRQNTTLIDSQGGAETHIREEGFTVTPADVEALRGRLAELLKEGDLAVFAGSLPPGMLPEHLAEFVQLCRGLGCTVAADTSGPALRAAVDAECSIIKPNLEELCELSGERIEDDEGMAAAAQVLLGRVKILLVTLGADGAACFTRDGAWRASAAGVEARNAVGAGDAFLAGFAVGYVRGLSLEASLRQAVACGAASVMVDWAGEVDAGRVRTLAKKVKSAAVPGF